MDDSFLNLIANIKNIDYNQLLLLLLLAFMRLATICSIAPFLGAKLVPAPARVALAMSLTLVLLPTIIFNSTTDFSTVQSYLILFSLKEIMIGFLLGFLSSVPFFIAQSAGIFIDFARGASSMMGQDATTQTQVSTIGIFMNYYLVVLFFSLGGPLLFFSAVENSFNILPVDGFLPLAFYDKHNVLWLQIIDLMNQVFKISIQLSAPALLAILMAEAFLGIANRLAPNVQISFLGMPLKSLLGLTLLWAGWYVLTNKLSDYSIAWIDKMNLLFN